MSEQLIYILNTCSLFFLLCVVICMFYFIEDADLWIKRIIERKIHGKERIIDILNHPVIIYYPLAIVMLGIALVQIDQLYDGALKVRKDLEFIFRNLFWILMFVGIVWTNKYFKKRKDETH